MPLVYRPTPRKNQSLAIGSLGVGTMRLAGGFVRGLGGEGQGVHLGVLSDRRRVKERRGLTVWRRVGAVADSAPVTRQCNQDHT
jgi:hypothetical protein